MSKRVAVVTGAGSGIGRAIAATYAQQGLHVVVVDIDRDRGNETVVALGQHQGGVEFIECDVSDDVSYAAMSEAVIERHGRCDVLVNNVGVLHPGQPQELDVGIWRDAFEIDVLSMVRGVRAFVPGMLLRSEGAVINTCSIGAFMPINPDIATLVTMKAAVFALSQSLHLTLAPQGIVVVCVCPGPVATPTHVDAAQAGIKAAGSEGIELRQPADVAEAAIAAVAERRFLAVTDDWHKTLIAQRYEDVDAALAADVGELAR